MNDKIIESEEATEWALMTPVERYLESCRLWEVYKL